MVHSYLRFSSSFRGWIAIAASGLTALLIAGAGCDRSASAKAEELEPAVEAPVAEITVPAPRVMEVPDATPDALPDTMLGEFQLTYYWMAKERSSTSEREVQLYTKRCEPLVEVSKSFAARLAREGTGKLLDGRTINVSGDCKCDHTPRRGPEAAGAVSLGGRGPGHGADWHHPVYSRSRWPDHARAQALGWFRPRRLRGRR